MRKKKNYPKESSRYRRPLNINVGMIIFAIIFIYMSFCVYTYVKKEKIQFEPELIIRKSVKVLDDV